MIVLPLRHKILGSEPFSVHAIANEDLVERIQRWGRAIGQAGRQPIDLNELLRLQRIVIGDAWFVCLGLHSEGGFVGERDRESGMPISRHYNARLEHLTRLVKGMVTFE